MLELMALNWFDLTTIGLSFFTIITVQIINSIYGLTTVATTAITNRNKLSKQISEQNKNHEDEDTLSLENLFPGDQTAIYESKRISYIIDELIETEGNYVKNLKKGLQHYGSLQKHESLPIGLKGADKQEKLLGNVEEIMILHEKYIYPIMQRNRNNLKNMFDEISEHIENNQFYCYVTFTMNKRASMQLRQEHRDWLQNYQTEIQDKLGIDSFLVQPIQRLTKYPLLLKQLISEFFGIKCKPVLTAICKLETRMRGLLDVVNQAEEIPYIEELPAQLSTTNLSYFRRSAEFEAYHYRPRKKFPAKVLLFDNCLLITEVRKKQLVYRHYYQWSALELRINTKKNITLLTKIGESTTNGGNDIAKQNGNHLREEYQFVATEALTIAPWLRSARKIVECTRLEISQKGKLSLPMDLVLGAAFSIWLIWHYL
ncbi:myosin-M heavy chain isoform X2 [Glossina fuscipes]|uniref:Myosin-M heavy chain isoform X2 n=1 Tax=Glossina fuscipes TaxID=7396 RepID=A0A9C5Z1J4_9MUSC|nr:myosin-M heavy chain isoform X2 [Glossina fuscipes]